MRWVASHSVGGKKRKAGVIIADVGQEAPRRFSGYSAVAPAVGDPHTPGH